MSPVWRHKETLNEKLLREGGDSTEGTEIEASADAESYEPGDSTEGTEIEASMEAESHEPDLDPEPDPSLGRSGAVSEALVAGLARRWRLREPHVIASAEVPDLTGESYTFTTVPDGSMLVDDDGEEDLSRLADAVEVHLNRPYRAEAVRHGDSSWAISAWPIQVASLAADGDELELTSVAGERTYSVDGEFVDEAFAPLALAQLGEAHWDDYALHASRLDDELWEIEVHPL
jgi:hypothetical protein